jgi:hypothetical protein
MESGARCLVRIGRQPSKLDFAGSNPAAPAILASLKLDYQRLQVSTQDKSLFWDFHFFPNFLLHTSIKFSRDLSYVFSASGGNMQPGSS